ncbi:hypothetical protein KAU33_00885 [Candidatus Dependentiae bacterium]|nr:hypothetical protein [Candidatus Dependentiae bacterium]
MKRFSIIFVLFFVVLFFVPSSADDALVFPKGVVRFLYYNTSMTADSFFDEDGEEISGGDYLGIPVIDMNEMMTWWGYLPHDYYIHKGKLDLTIMRSDFIFDVGVTDKISVRLWFPYYFKKQTKVSFYPPINGEEYWLYNALTGDDLPSNQIVEKNAKGLADMMVGYKQQIIGSNDIERGLRMAYSVGLRLPTSEDWDPVTNPHGDRLDDGQMDVGLWLHVDYVINDNLYINLFTKYEHQMPGTQKINPNDTVTWPFLAPGCPYDNVAVDIDYEPGTYMFAELEPHYKIPLKDKANLELLLSFAYEKEEAGVYKFPEELAGGIELDLEDDWELITITPTFTIENWDKDAVPFEFEIKYTYAYDGKKYPVFNRWQFNLKIYTKLF